VAEEQEVREESKRITKESVQFEDEKDGVDESEEDYKYWANQDELYE
jgi:hypothetical protein